MWCALECYNVCLYIHCVCTCVHVHVQLYTLPVRWGMLVVLRYYCRTQRLILELSITSEVYISTYNVYVYAIIMMADAVRQRTTYCKHRMNLIANVMSVLTVCCAVCIHVLLHVHVPGYIHAVDTTYNSCVRIPTVNICVVVFRVGIYIPVAYWMSSLPCSPVYTLYIPCIALYLCIYMYTCICSTIPGVCVASLSGERTACMCWPTTPGRVQLPSSPYSCRLLLASPLMCRIKMETLVGLVLYSPSHSLSLPSPTLPPLPPLMGHQDCHNNTDNIIYLHNHVYTCMCRYIYSCLINYSYYAINIVKAMGCVNLIPSRGLYALSSR